MFLDGLGVAQDHLEAMRLYREAADQGIVSAQYKLGYIFIKGICGTQDSLEAVRWFRLAAAHGDVDAQNALKIITKS